jgi:hypothetical protein
VKKYIFIILIVIIACGAGFFSIKLYNYYLTRTFQKSSENTFYLLSVLVEHYLQELEDTQKEGTNILQINKIFDNIVKSSELLYFAVLDENKNPIIFIILYY